MIFILQSTKIKNVYKNNHMIINKTLTCLYNYKIEQERSLISW